MSRFPNRSKQTARVKDSTDTTRKPAMRMGPVDASLMPCPSATSLIDDTTLQALLHCPIDPFFVIRHFVKQNDVVIGAVATSHRSGLGVHAVMMRDREFILLPCLVIIAHQLDGQLQRDGGLGVLGNQIGPGLAAPLVEAREHPVAHHEIDAFTC